MPTAKECIGKYIRVDVPGGPKKAQGWIIGEDKADSHFAYFFAQVENNEYIDWWWICSDTKAEVWGDINPPGEIVELAKEKFYNSCSIPEQVDWFYPAAQKINKSEDLYPHICTCGSKCYNSGFSIKCTNNNCMYFEGE